MLDAKKMAGRIDARLPVRGSRAAGGLTLKARVGFVVEQALGHVAYGLSLRKALAGRSDLDVAWIEVPYEPSGLSRLTPLGRNWTLRGSVRASRLIRQAHRQQPLDAMFLHTQTISLFAGGHMARIPTLLSLDATPLNLDEIAPAYGHRVSHKAVERLKKRLLTHVVRKAAHYTTWSGWARESLVRDYGADRARITVVHPGATIGNFPGPQAKQSHEGRRMRLLFVGGDFERKGGDLLLEVFDQHLRETCELHIVTAADLPERAGVYVYRDVKPHSPQLLDLYQKCDVFVLPTRGDCLAVVMGEAMAAGMPIITTNVGAHAEAVEDGVSGYVIDVNDASALRDRLLALATDPDGVRTMGLRARAIGEDRFDIDKGANQLGDILVRLAGRSQAVVRPVVADMVRS